MPVALPAAERHCESQYLAGRSGAAGNVPVPGGALWVPLGSSSCLAQVGRLGGALSPPAAPCCPVSCPQYGKGSELVVPAPEVVLAAVVLRH